MARTRTFIELQNSAYELADEEGNDASDARFPRAKVGRYINEGCAEAWGFMVEASPKDWAENATPYSVTTTSNTSSYALPNTVYKIISVRLIDGSNSYTLERFNESLESMLEDSSTRTTHPAHYQQRGQTLYLAPPTAANLTLRIRFVPHYTDMTANANTWDAILPGSDQYPVVYAARQMAIKNDEWEKVTMLGAELQRLEAKIKSGSQRDITMPRRIANTRGLRFHRLYTRYR